MHRRRFMHDAPLSNPSTPCSFYSKRSEVKRCQVKHCQSKRCQSKRCQSKRLALAAVAICLAACHSSRESAQANEAQQPTQPGLEAREEPQGELRLAMVTPELTRKSAAVLEQHADAPLGTEIPFTLDGKEYVGRLETHVNEEKGEHKGLTVYTREAASQGEHASKE